MREVNTLFEEGDELLEHVETRRSFDSTFEGGDKGGLESFATGLHF